MLAGGGLEYLNPRLGPGEDSRVPSIEQVFDPASAPGLGESVDYLRTMAFVEVDYREPKNARKGGWYRFDLSHFDDRTTGRYHGQRASTPTCASSSASSPAGASSPPGCSSRRRIPTPAR